jgi:4-hydroxy-3-polyprenylbenzoate decarboxylase
MNKQMAVKRWVLGMTGASGAAYGVVLCRSLLELGIDVHLVITEAGWRVLKEELGWDAHDRQAQLDKHFASGDGNVIYYPIKDIGASIASCS